MDELLALPMADRVEVLQRLRDNIQSEAKPSELSDELLQLLDQRLDAFEKDETAGSSWDDVSRRVTQRLSGK